jgi:hypothetical protein
LPPFLKKQLANAIFAKNITSRQNQTKIILSKLPGIQFHTTRLPYVLPFLQPDPFIVLLPPDKGTIFICVPMRSLGAETWEIIPISLPS